MNAVFQIARRCSLVRSRVIPSAHRWVELRPAAGTTFPSRSSSTTNGESSDVSETALLSNDIISSTTSTTTNPPDDKTLSPLDDVKATQNDSPDKQASSPFAPDDKISSPLDDAKAVVQSETLDKQASSPFAPGDETTSSPFDDIKATHNDTADKQASSPFAPDDKISSPLDDAKATHNETAVDENASWPFDTAAATTPRIESAANTIIPDPPSSSQTTVVAKAFHFSRCASRELPHLLAESSSTKKVARSAHPTRNRSQSIERTKEPRAANPAMFRLEYQAARVRPRANNPISFRAGFLSSNEQAKQRRTVGPRNSYLHDGETMQPRHGSLFVAKSDRQKNPIQRRQPLTWSENPTLGEHLQAANEAVPFSAWVEIQGISPVSSLDSMLSSITAALDAEQARGMIDLDAPWSEGQPIPFLEPVASSDEATDKKNKWVRKAKVILSPFGRPKGWYMQFDNRSVVNSLLKHVQDTPLKCAWKDVNVTEYISKDGRVGAPPESDNIPVNSVLDEQVSDHTLRVENVPSVRPARLVSFFSRYDLRSVNQWHGRTSDGKMAPSSVYLVHFADASWARAALREVQGTYMLHHGERMYVDSTKPTPLRLSQYPKQLL